MADHAQILNPLCANMYYSKQHLFFTNNNPMSIRKKPKKNPKKKLKQLEKKFQEYSAQMNRENHHQMTDDNDRSHDKPPFMVDVVFTWVDNTKKHANKRKYWQERTKKGSSVSSDNDVNRYSNHDEIRYAIRSIFKFIPWIRCIFVVVDDAQFPKWLSNESGNAQIPVCVVPHSILYGQQFRKDLPTFNSQSLECHLHRIPHLSEQFIYFNDDMFVGASVHWSDFFTEEGHPKYIFTGVIPTGKKTASMSKHTMAWINNGSLLDKVFADKQDRYRKYPAHQACPMLKSTFTEMWEHPRSNKYLVRTSQSKFREHYDVYPVGLLVYWNLYSNQAEEHKMGTFFTQIYDHTHTLTVCRNIIERQPKLFCLNDGLVKRRKSQSQILKAFIKFMYPDPSPVEILQNADPHAKKKTAVHEKTHGDVPGSYDAHGTVSRNQVMEVQKQRARLQYGQKPGLPCHTPGVP